jgi:hypothetical protein
LPQDGVQATGGDRQLRDGAGLFDPGMAAASAAPTAVIPPSPAPFTPSGLSGLGASSRRITSTSGTSRQVGCR